MADGPFFSIVTVTYEDAWALIKTARSVFEQSFEDFEFIIVDGDSGDGSKELIEFWKTQGLATKTISEKDSGVYNAMNKALSLCSGQYVCYLNANDVFAHTDVLSRVHAVLSKDSLDGVIGWGELNQQFQAIWARDEAVKLSSLGFCHQALFVRRDVLEQYPFDERSFKTDSDTLQLGQLCANGYNIEILPEILAKRGGDPGISADQERTHVSIVATLLQEYPSLNESEAVKIIEFRRKCTSAEDILGMLEKDDVRLVKHIAYMILDTMFMRQSGALSEVHANLMIERAIDALSQMDDFPHHKANINQLVYSRNSIEILHKAQATARADLDRTISEFHAQEERRYQKVRTEKKIGYEGKGTNLVVSMTSFPARLKTVHFAIRSLMEQTCRPAEIHLWLGRDEIPGPSWLPGRLKELIPHGLQVHFVKNTCHQYDKFMHNAALNYDRPFVIVDDDVIYPPNALETLHAGHKLHPHAVVGNRCHWMAVDDDGDLAPYKDWTREVMMDTPHMRLMPTGAGGVLYPPGFVSDLMVTDVRNILRLAPYADDIWLKACAMARGIPTYATELSNKGKWYLRYTPTMLEGTLMQTNVERGLNDIQITQCLNWLASVRPDWKQDLVESEVA